MDGWQETYPPLTSYSPKDTHTHTHTHTQDSGTISPQEHTTSDCKIVLVSMHLVYLQSESDLVLWQYKQNTHG